MPKYRISELIVEIVASLWALHKNLKSFLCSSEDVDVRCNVVFGKRPILPLDKANLIIKTSGKSIYEFQGSIHSVCGYDYDVPSYIVATKDWSFCTMYIDPVLNEPDDPGVAESVSNGILAALRDVMIAVLAQKQGLIIHSCTIEWQGKGIIFSAPSGTGKSTHAHLWQQRYKTSILDGDSIACRIINGLPVVYGLPWCGTSGEFMNKSAPLGAIVFLEQAGENSIKKLDQAEAFMRLAARSFLLRWDVELTNQSLNTVHDIINNTNCFLLKCRTDFEAVELVKKCLEEN